MKPQVELKEIIGMQITIYNYKYKRNVVLIELCINELVRYSLLSEPN